MNIHGKVQLFKIEERHRSVQCSSAMDLTDHWSSNLKIVFTFFVFCRNIMIIFNRFDKKCPLIINISDLALLKMRIRSQLTFSIYLFIYEKLDLTKSLHDTVNKSLMRDRKTWFSAVKDLIRQLGASL